MMKILLVDDAEPIRAIQKKVLAALGAVEFVEAADGMDALRLFKNACGAFDLILIDYDMPQIDGNALARRFRQLDKRTPIIMCTAQAGREHVVDAIRAGVNNYLVKPFTPEALLQRVRQTLDKTAAVAAAQPDGA
jgi:two-component system chemotaxis response regulator CheY